MKHSFPSPPAHQSKIAILMPIYNGHEFFTESFASVLAQTHHNWILYIGINGHPKNSPVYDAILKHITPFARRHDIVLWDFGEQPNKSATLNKMVSMLSPDKTKYVALLDVDDIWLPKKLERQVPFLFHYHVIGAQCVYFGDAEGVIPTIPLGDFTRGYDFKSSNPIINSSVLIDVKFAKWNSDSTIEDYELWLELNKRGGVRFYNCDEVLVRHRIHDSSAFNHTNHELVEGLIGRF